VGVIHTCRRVISRNQADTGGRRGKRAKPKHQTWDTVTGLGTRPVRVQHRAFWAASGSRRRTGACARCRSPFGERVQVAGIPSPP